MITLLLFTGLVLSIRGKLTPKRTGVIVAAYFGTGIISNIFALMQVPGMMKMGQAKILLLKQVKLLQRMLICV